MTTIDARGNLHDVAGKFAEKHHSAPSGALLGDDDPQIEMSAGWDGKPMRDPETGITSPVPAALQQVLRSPGFAVDAIQQAGYEIIDLRDEGDCVYVEFYEPHDNRVKWRARIGRDGEVFDGDRMLCSIDGLRWVPDPAEWHDDVVEQMKETIHRARLVAAGVLATEERDDPIDYPEPYKARHVGSRVTDSGYVDAAEVARLTRAGIKRAVELGVLPKEWRISVRSEKYGGGQAVDVTVEGLKQVTRESADLSTSRRNRETGEAKRVRALIQDIGEQWNVDRSNAAIDYFDTRYYLRVSLRSPEEAAYYQRMRSGA